MKGIQLFTASILFFFVACSNENKNTNSTNIEQQKIKEENVSYAWNNVNMNGFVAYDESTDARRPVVLIIHEWWGLNDYIKGRAKQLARLGYLAMAVDMYGNGKTVDNPNDAGKLSVPFYKDPIMAKARFDAALAKIKTYSVADTTKIGAIGYCFGGGMVLNFARMGEDLKGVVSFHGSLLGTPLDKALLKAEIFVCHGEDDKFVKPEEVIEFKKEMDSAGVAFSFRSYPGATHAFTNPGATEIGKKYNIPIAYNAAADTASFKEMKIFLNDIFK